MPVAAKLLLEAGRVLELITPVVIPLEAERLISPPLPALLLRLVEEESRLPVRIIPLTAERVINPPLPVRPKLWEELESKLPVVIILPLVVVRIIAPPLPAVSLLL